MKHYTDIEKQTKKVYVEQHKNYARDQTIFDRHRVAAQDLNTYDLPETIFRGAEILDAGCGNTGYFQVAMFNLGAKHVACLDIGTEWIDELKKVLLHHGVPENFCSFIDASTLDIPFPSECFDLVCSNGVLMHLESKAMAANAITELTRVCRVGGHVYAHIGIDNPGIVDRYIVKALRQAYSEDLEFKSLVDNLDPAEIINELSEIYSESASHDERMNAITIELLKSLITLDTTTFLQNMLQVPMQIGPLLSEEWGREQFAKNSLVMVRRPTGIYWLRNDFRRFLAPIHYNLKTKLATIFYGNGHVKLIGRKSE